MSKKINGVNFSKLPNAVAKRLKVVKRLSIQLEKGTKNTKEGEVSLSEYDVTRIKKELETLKTRV